MSGRAGARGPSAGERRVEEDHAVAVERLSKGDGEQPELSVGYPADGMCVIRVNCELDMVTAPSLTQLLTQEVAAGHRAVVVDLAGCGFLGSSGLAALVAARDQAIRARTTLALAGLTAISARALEATALTPLFDTFPTVDDAVTAIARG
jgi:anti-sigma B factor antagonist